MSSGSSLGRATSTRHIHSRFKGLEGEDSSTEPRHTPDWFGDADIQLVHTLRVRVGERVRRRHGDLKVVCLAHAGTYTSEGGTLVISAAGSGFRADSNTRTVGDIGMRILVDGIERGGRCSMPTSFRATSHSWRDK